MRGRRHSRGFQQRPKRPTQWVATSTAYSPQGGTALSNGVVNAKLLAGSAPTAITDVPTIDRYTVERIRGSIGFSLSSTAATNSEIIVSMGIIVVSEAAGASVTAVDPSSSADAGRDWLWLMHKTWSWDPPGAQFLNPAGPSDMGFFDVDVKARRVIREGHALMLFTNTFLPANNSLSMLPALRTLISRVA